MRPWALLIALTSCSLFHDYSGPVIQYQDDPRCSRPREEILAVWNTLIGEARVRGYLKTDPPPKFHDVCVSSERAVDCGVGKMLYGCVYWNGWVVVAGGAKLHQCDWRCTLTHEFLNWLGVMTHSLKDWPDTEAEGVADARYIELKHAVIDKLGLSQ